MVCFQMDVWGFLFVGGFAGLDRVLSCFGRMVAVVGREHTPGKPEAKASGYQPLLAIVLERAKPKGLAYLEAVRALRE